MDPIRITLMIVGFFVVGLLTLLGGWFVIDYIFEMLARDEPDQATTAAVYVPIYLLIRFIGMPIIAIFAASCAAWGVAKY